MRSVCFPEVARTITLVICAVMAGQAVRAGEVADAKSQSSSSTEEEAPEYKNWIVLGLGGVAIDGDAAQFKQEHRISGDIFGGIEDMHYEQAIGKDGLFAIDGRAIFDNHDYNVKLELSKPGLGYIRAGYTEFRSWYDGNGGFFPINGQFFNPPHQEMTLDRGEAWVELGLRAKNLPEITLRYSHQFRDGQKDSTSWGDTTLTGLAVNPARKIAPAFRNINETRDIFAVDISQNFGKTDVGLGMRYQHDEVDNSLNLWRGAGQLPPLVAAPGANRVITQKDKIENDMFSGHVTTETRFSDSLWFTTAYSYTTLGSDLAGSRIIGADYNASFTDPVLTLRPFDEGFLNLAGQSQVDQHVFNLNLLWTPLKDLTVLTAFRYTLENKNSSSTYLVTNTEPNFAPFNPGNPAGGFHQSDPVMTASNSWQTFNKFAQRLELRYTGIANWLFYAGGEWEEEYGDIHERLFPNAEGGEEPADKKLDLFWQKYTAGFNWYPLDRLNLSGQYYHKVLEYDSQSNAGHQSLVNEQWNTDDVNVRLTWRPRIPPKLGTMTLVTRYDFVSSLVEGQWELPGRERFLPEHTALITNHVITESLTWNPLARLYLQGNLSYVLNQTDTPANNINFIPQTSPTVINFTNDYWTASVGTGYILDDKTDLHVDYSYYRADNYNNNSRVAQPYGMGATEHTASASISRELTKRVRLTVRYSYFDFTDQTSGGHNSYRAHSVYSTLQFRF